MLRRIAIACLSLFTTACATVPFPFEDADRTRVIRTGGPNQSMIYVARHDHGVVLFDLGWAGAAGALRDGLRAMGVDSSAVTTVFLTHAHRDHLAAWPVVPHATFIVAAPEDEFLAGRAQYRARVVDAAESVIATNLPPAGSLDVRPFARDTVFFADDDPVRAFPVPGHTPGSAAYLVDGVLLLGDAITPSLLGGFRPAHELYSENPARARVSLRTLFERLDAYDVDWVCTAHARCARYTAEFRRDVLGG